MNPYIARRVNLPQADTIAENRNHMQISGIPSPFEGRFAIVTNVGSGMRWTQRAARRGAPRGRPSRVVLAPLGWR
jgi:hypothetical protein